MRLQCHRRILTALSLLMLWSLGALCQADWPRFLGSEFDGTAQATIADRDWATPPTALWSVEVGQGYGLGSVADGVYYHFDASNGSTIAKAERLTARDLQTGKTLWTVSQPLAYRDLFGYEEGPRGTPTVAGERIYTFGVAGQLTSRNRSDGKLVWTVDTSKKFGVVQNFFGVGSSPLIIGDRVVVMVGGSPPGDQQVAPLQLDRVSPNGSALVAFDTSDGKELWRTGDDLASYSSPRTISIDGRTYVLVLARSGLMLIDPAEGKTLWQMDHRASILESVNAMMPVVRGDEVFISECYQRGSVLLKVNTDSYKVLWSDPDGNRRKQSMRSHWATPVLVDGFLYGCSGRNAPDSDLRCIDWATGEVQWVDERRTRTSITRVGDYLVVLEERGTIDIIRAAPGQMEIVATWPLNQPAADRPAIRYPCWAAPIVVDDKLIVRGDERVVCYKLP